MQWIKKYLFMAELKQARIKFKKDKLDNEGELQPDISVKVDELFIRSVLISIFLDILKLKQKIYLKGLVN